MPPWQAVLEVFVPQLAGIWLVALMLVSHSPSGAWSFRPGSVEGLLSLLELTKDAWPDQACASDARELAKDTAEAAIGGARWATSWCSQNLSPLIT